MTKQRCLLIVKSIHHQNTMRVAEAIAETLEAEILAPDEVTQSRIDSCDLVGFGSGIYYARHHRELRKAAGQFDGQGRRAFIFSTAGLPWFNHVLHWSLRSRLIRRGWSIAGEFCAPGWDRWGPLLLIGGLHRNRPDERDFNRARQWAGELKEQLPSSGSRD